MACFSIVTAKAQKHSMLEGNPEWVYCCYNFGFVWKHKGLSFFRYYIDGEYVDQENGEVFKILCMEMYTDKGEIIVGDTTLYYQDKNDGKKKFVVAMLKEKDGFITGGMFNQQDCCFYADRPEEEFIYDFNLKKGDEYYVRYLNRNMLHKHTVKDRRSIPMADGTERDLITVTGIEAYKPGYAKSWTDFPGFYDLEIIDGIGCINSVGQLLSSHYYWEIDYYSIMHAVLPEPCCTRLNMFRQNGEIVYLAPESDPDSEIGEYYTTFKPMPFYPEVTPTAIREIMADRKKMGSRDIYDISGQKLKATKKGINIVDGKKLIIK